MKTPRPQSIADLNAQAITLLRHGHFREALFLIQSALKIVQSSIHIDSLTTTTQLRTVSLRQESRDLEIDQTAFLIYDRAFVFGDDVALNLASGALMYNMGLTYHVLALTSPEHRNKLAKAQGLYKVALQILEIDATGDESLLVLASLNNTTHIHALLFEPAKLLTCVQYLNTVLQHYCPPEASEEASNDWVHFHLNIVIYGQKTTTPTAPAA